MHVDDNLYAAAGEDNMRWAMRCSIHALNILMGEPDPTVRPNPVDFDKFTRELVGYERRQLGYLTNSRLLSVTIPNDKRESMLHELTTSWGPHRRSFKLLEAAQLEGTLASLCPFAPGTSSYSPIFIMPFTTCFNLTTQRDCIQRQNIAL